MSVIDTLSAGISGSSTVMFTGPDRYVLMLPAMAFPLAVAIAVVIRAAMQMSLMFIF